MNMLVLPGATVIWMKNILSPELKKLFKRNKVIQFIILNLIFFYRQKLHGVNT